MVAGSPAASRSDDFERSWSGVRASASLDRSLLAFGDDGTGDPFCTYHDGPVEVVARWSMIERTVCEQYESMDAFVTAWLPPR